jgi:hypothetical protein
VYLFSIIDVNIFYINLVMLDLDETNKCLKLQNREVDGATKRRGTEAC